MRGPARATGICHHRDADLVDLMDALARSEARPQPRAASSRHGVVATGARAGRGATGTRRGWRADGLGSAVPALPFAATKRRLNLVSAAATVLTAAAAAGPSSARRCCWAIGIGPASNSACKVLALCRADGVGVGNTMTSGDHCRTSSACWTASGAPSSTPSGLVEDLVAMAVGAVQQVASPSLSDAGKVGQQDQQPAGGCRMAAVGCHLGSSPSRSPPSRRYVLGRGLGR